MCQWAENSFEGGSPPYSLRSLRNGGSERVEQRNPAHEVALDFTQAPPRLGI